MMTRHRLAAAALLATASALTTTTPKQRLRSRLQPSKDELLCDPQSKEPLAVKAQYFNGVTKKTYSSPTATYGTRFGFVDLAEAKRPRTAREIADELREQIIGRSAAQRVQEDTFRNPFVSFPVWRSTSVSGAPDNSSLSHFPAMTWPRWLGRAARNRHRHAIKQASRRWRGG